MYGIQAPVGISPRLGSALSVSSLHCLKALPPEAVETGAPRRKDSPPAVRDPACVALLHSVRGEARMRRVLPHAGHARAHEVPRSPQSHTSRSPRSRRALALTATIQKEDKDTAGSTL